MGAIYNKNLVDYDGVKRFCEVNGDCLKTKC
jgi:hypothetical protein